MTVEIATSAMSDSTIKQDKDIPKKRSINCPNPHVPKYMSCHRAIVFMIACIYIYIYIYIYLYIYMVVWWKQGNN